MTDLTLESLAERVGRLESRNHRLERHDPWPWTGALILVLITGSIAAVAADIKPRIEMKHDTPVIILPDSPKAAIRKYNRKMQLRNWDDYHPVILQIFRSNYPKRIPWAVWGDFDGNGRTDVALDLRDPKNSMGKVVAYHQSPRGKWSAYLLTQYGSDRAKDPDFLFLSPGPHDLGSYDLISYAVPESDVGVDFYWKDGKYHWEAYAGPEGDTP